MNITIDKEYMKVSDFDKLELEDVNYYIKKHVKAQKKDFMLEVREARLRKKVE